jgi:hypothetical protein
MAASDNPVDVLKVPGLPHRKVACAECPWRRSNPPGKFPPERYIALANTTVDMSMRIFACHMAKEDKPATCAGWLQMASAHNFAVRMAMSTGRLDLSELVPITGLYETYREMAVANGVAGDDPALARVRDDAQRDFD